MRKEELAFHENRAKGGLASVCIGLGIVDPVGRSHTKEITLYDVMSLPSLKEYANTMHKHQCIATMELAHGGKYASARSHGEHKGRVIGPNNELTREGNPVTAMDETEIERVADCFAAAAKLCQDAGIDMVLVHGGHGWLLGQFSSPTMNHRQDRWGGSLENRMRFPLLVIEKIRKAAPKVLIEYRMSGSELIEGGYTIEEGVKMAEVLDGKVDIIHVSAGVHDDDDAFTITHPSMFVEHGVNVHLAAEIKKHVKTPVATLGGLSDPDMMEQILREGKVDIVEVARQSLADPYLPMKAFTGRADDITKCCRCYTCFFNYLTNRTYCCAFNPVIGNELEHKWGFPATTSKKVVVVGGGVVGMEAAITAASRGHQVALYEKSDRLGGLLSEQYIPFKNNMYHFTEVLAKRVQKAHVEVHLNTELTPQMVADLHADAVIATIGAKPIVPNIPGIHSDKVVGLSALESIEPKLGDKVVIVGGGLVGSEVAIHVDMLGKDVTVVEMKQDWAMDAYFMHKNAMKIYVRDSDIRFLCNTTAKAVTEQGLLCVNQDGKEMELQADTILLAAGFKVDQNFRDDFYHTADQVIMVGDAIRPARVVDAVSSGHYAALDI